MSVTTAYAPRHAPPPRLTPILLASLDAVVAAIAILAVVLALLALSHTTPVAAARAPQSTVSTPAAIHPSPGPAATQAPAPPRAAPVQRYTVRAGDSLWSVSLARYGTGSDWPRLYIVNRVVIGSSPDHIEPGETLAIPAISTGGTSP